MSWLRRNSFTAISGRPTMTIIELNPKMLRFNYFCGQLVTAAENGSTAAIAESSCNGSTLRQPPPTFESHDNLKADRYAKKASDYDFKPRK